MRQFVTAPLLVVYGLVIVIVAGYVFRKEVFGIDTRSGATAGEIHRSAENPLTLTELRESAENLEAQARTMAQMAEVFHRQLDIYHKEHGDMK